MTESYDAIIVGAGPNGLSAAVRLATAGLSVCVLEAEQQIGGGARTEQLTLPNFLHDTCSTIHPMGLASPFFQKLLLQKYGVDWIQPPLALAHPFDHQPAAFLTQSVDETAAGLEEDGKSYRSFMQPFVDHGGKLIKEILQPIRIPRHPFLMARFGLSAMRSAVSLAESQFKTDRARGLFLGCAAHSIVDLNYMSTAAAGLVFPLIGHLVGWPIVRGGSQKIADALHQYLVSLGGVVQTGRRVDSLQKLPHCRAILLDVSPKQLAEIAGEALPVSYREKLLNFRYGPGAFKIDWALSGPIPWKDPICKKAGTVHLGSLPQEIIESEKLTWNGKIAPKPFVLVAQQTLFDDTRAPEGKHTGWAYCHVPNGVNHDMSEAIESQVERFAPGFRDLILARAVMNPAQLQQHNANLIGGDIAGGANNFFQLIARPVFKWNPYSTPNPRIFLCSSSTSPGGGVHGMCGYNAANVALKEVFGKKEK